MKDIKILSRKEISKLLLTLPEAWKSEGGILRREYTFGNFTEAMDFVGKIAKLAEKMDHHPDILISYNKVRVELFTHSAKGLTARDFDFARGLGSQKRKRVVV